MSTDFAIFVLAAFFEVAGCFALWMWLRRDGSPLVAVPGAASLVAFALAPTRVDSAFAARAYAAYGGIYAGASLLWLWVIEGQTPARADLAGAALAIAGALVILAFAARQTR